MEDEDLRVEVRDLDHERVKEVVGVAAGVEVALELGNVPEENEVFGIIKMSLYLYYSNLRLK